MASERKRTEPWDRRAADTRKRIGDDPEKRLYDKLAAKTWKLRARDFVLAVVCSAGFA